MKNHLQTGATIRLALRGEHALLQGIMRRASLVSETYRDELLAHPEAMSLPVEQIAEGAAFVAETQGTVDGFCVVIMSSVDEAELEGCSSSRTGGARASAGRSRNTEQVQRTHAGSFDHRGCRAGGASLLRKMRLRI